MSNLSFSVDCRSKLPMLAFAAEFIAGREEIRVVCGNAVEVDNLGVIAGAWAGPFADRAIDRAITSIGTAIRLTDSGPVAVAGSASASPLYYGRKDKRLIISNSMALCLAFGEDAVLDAYPFYPQDLATFALGSHRYRPSVPTRNGTLSVYYGSMMIGSDLNLQPAEITPPPEFPDFQTYRTYLVDQTRWILANAADSTRAVRYHPTVALSAGYDSPAAAVIARDAGCTIGFTFGQPVDRPDAKEDSGATIGRMMGLKVEEYDTFAYRDRLDCPEIEFIASSFGGGQVYLSVAQDALIHRVVLSGFGGDRIWSMAYGQNGPPHFPFYIGGYSQVELYLRAPAFDLSIPVIGSKNSDDIGGISRSRTMTPWAVGGAYDRPIPRRIVEEAGIPRGSFADRKRRITPDYDNLSRRTADLKRFLSPTSQAAFDRWFDTVRPLNRFSAFVHRVLVETVGRIVWSGKLIRALRHLGITWPPAPAKIIHLKVPMRRNAFVFNWAMKEQVRRYQTILNTTASNEVACSR